jgi:hypothetical protein
MSRSQFDPGKTMMATRKAERVMVFFALLVRGDAVINSNLLFVWNVD